jgi:orotidine-5'-phosphate decarboxylase
MCAASQFGCRKAAGMLSLVSGCHTNQTIQETAMPSFFELLPGLRINADQITRFAVETDQSDQRKQVLVIRFSDGSTETVVDAEAIRKFTDKFTR